MGNGSVFKLTGRSIRSFFGRYMALLLIVALSVGFFAGLKVTKDAMANAEQEYLDKQHFYDFRLISTLGFSFGDVNSISEEEYVDLAEGSKTVDALIINRESVDAYKLISLPKQVNIPSLTAGRMPKAVNECLVDRRRFGEEDIGRSIEISDKNPESVKEQLAGTEYIIVGLVDSPVYMGLDRGSTGIGGGTLAGFCYLPEANFNMGAYTEINVMLKEREHVYSDAYKSLISRYEDRIAETAEELAEARYNDLLDKTGLPKEFAEAAGLKKPEVYVLTREENAGYISFESDTSIVSGIANIFPVFFILIAMLVCITTMSRMVDEERTQIGTLKSLGFGNGAITAKYLLYAGSATVIGWLAGFIFGTWGLPQVFWYAYGTIYGFAPMPYMFSSRLAVITLVVSLAGILGSAWLSCRKELEDAPARLIRPKGTKNGKRIFLERITPVWKRFPFLMKVTVRNMFRYKRRLIMMLVGIGCCAGLVVTAFGVRDSMINLGKWQFEGVQIYDMEAVLTEGSRETVYEKLDDIDGVKDYLGCNSLRVELHGEEVLDLVGLYSFDDAGELSRYWKFHSEEEELAFPGRGEALINTKAAGQLSLSVGDMLEIRDSDDNVMEVKISGIFDNYINNYVIISDGTYEDAFDDWEVNTVLLNTEGNDRDISEQLTDIEEVTNVSQLSKTRERIDSALSCLNYIIWLIVGFSGALAFIVIFNLTNINLAERSREIATVQVLGFYPRETESYVLHENLILSILAAFIGMPLGTLFHRIVMDMIVIDMMAFNNRITALSYVLAFICTVAFSFVVNLVMKRQIAKIKMAESLKAVE